MQRTLKEIECDLENVYSFDGIESTFSRLQIENFSALTIKHVAEYNVLLFNFGFYSRLPLRRYNVDITSSTE